MKIRVAKTRRDVFCTPVLSSGKAIYHTGGSYPRGDGTFLMWVIYGPDERDRMTLNIHGKAAEQLRAFHERLRPTRSLPVSHSRIRRSSAG